MGISKARKETLKKQEEPSTTRNKPVSEVTHKLHKLLAQTGLGSRREMEKIIATGQVTINGRIAEIGDRVGIKDVVRVKKRIINIKFNEGLPRIILYHKPEGEIVSQNDPYERPSVFNKLPKLKTSKWVSVGRLDFNTCGLLIFTTDGVLANRLMHPRFEVEREYAVRIVGQLDSRQITLLTKGIKLKDGIAKFDHLSDEGGKSSNHWYKIILKEGKNREVRRMFEALGITVSRLIRVRFGPVKLPPRLRRGKTIELNKAEVESLLKLSL